MNIDIINDYIAEIADDAGFVNIDQSDIEAFQKDVDIVDAVKIKGKCEQIGGMLEDALSTLCGNCRGKSCVKILFSIKIAELNELLMKHINEISNIVGRIDENINVVWGLSIKESLKGDDVELIILVGFGNCVVRC